MLDVRGHGWHGVDRLYSPIIRKISGRHKHKSKYAGTKESVETSQSQPFESLLPRLQSDEPAVEFLTWVVPSDLPRLCGSQHVKPQHDPRDLGFCGQRRWKDLKISGENYRKNEKCCRWATTRDSIRPCTKC